MIYSISIIKTKELDKIQILWKSLLTSQKNQFIHAELYEAFENYFWDYQFVSVIAFDSKTLDEKNHFFLDVPEFNSLKESGSENLLCETQYVTRKDLPYDEENIYLINPFEVTNDQIPELYALWEEDNDYMQSQPGAVGTHLYKVLDPDKRFKFINIAEWKTRDDWFRAFKTEEFGKFLAIHQSRNHKFFPALCKLVEFIDK